MPARNIIPMLTCGYCSFSKRHDLCPGGVRNGDGSIRICECKEPGCLAGTPRCTDCNNREAGTVGPNWKCIDKMACEADIERRMASHPTIQFIRAHKKASRAGKAKPYEEPKVVERSVFREEPEGDTI